MFEAVIEPLHCLPPLARFAVAMLIPLTVPPLCWQVRLPDVVGLLMAGVLLGPYGFGVAAKNAEVAHFFAESSSVRRLSSLYRTMNVTPWYASRFEDVRKHRQHQRKHSWAD
jgi:hypothetical protein